MQWRTSRRASLGGGSLREKQQPCRADGEVTTERLFKVDNSAILYALTKEGKTVLSGTSAQYQKSITQRREQKRLSCSLWKIQASLLPHRSFGEEFGKKFLHWLHG